MTEPEESKYDIVYNKMYELYNLLLRGEHDRPSRSYFDEIRQYYKEGDRMTRIRAIEIVLRIIQGRIIKNAFYKEPTSDLGVIGIVQFRLSQIKNRMLGRQSEDKRPQKSYITYKNSDLLDWLQRVLTDEKDEKILTTFFIFVKSNWDHFTTSSSSSHIRIISLHHNFVRVNTSYKKLASFDRLYFS